MPLFVFSERCLKPGHYNIPFAESVPGSLPGTFVYGESVNDTSARIIYKLGDRVIGEGAGIPKTPIPLVISQMTYAVDSPANLQKKLQGCRLGAVWVRGRRGSRQRRINWRMLLGKQQLQ